MIDIHCHILPGIDDGPRDWSDSLALCAAMANDGIRQAVATPHLIDGVYDNLAARVQPLVRELDARLRDAGIELEISGAAEVDLSSCHVGAVDDALPRLGRSAVLLEMPVAVIPQQMGEILFRLESHDVLPVIAHPERNELLQAAPERAQAWVDAGACLQLDADSLIGVWGRHTQRCAEWLLASGLFHAMASDAHSCDRRPPRLAEGLARARAIVGDDANRLVEQGPLAILEGHRPDTPLCSGTLPKQRGRRGWLGRLLGRRD